MLLLIGLAACSSPAKPTAQTCVDAGTAALRSQAASSHSELLLQYDVQSNEDSRADLSRTLRREYKLELRRIGNTYSPDVVDMPSPETLAALERDVRVLYAEPNQRVQATSLPNDPLAKNQWALSEFGVPQAWAESLEEGGSVVIVAVVDTGVTSTHPDLQAVLLTGCDLYGADDDTNPGESRLAGHGTHMTGIIGARRGNAIGVAGLASAETKLLPVKVFNDAGDTSNVAVLVEGILWAAGLEVPGFARNPTPAQIINISLGAQEESDALAEAVTAAQNAGALVIAASGNDAKRDAITAPANLSNVLAVGAVDRDGVRNEFSNYARQGRSVDLMAPGGKPGLCPNATVLSTFPTGVTGPQPGYGCLEGTSVAAAFVSGVAALVLSAEPNLSPQDLKQRLLSSTRAQPERSRSEYGAGILCADTAVGATTRCGDR